MNDARLLYSHMPPSKLQGTRQARPRRQTRRSPRNLSVLRLPMVRASRVLTCACARVGGFLPAPLSLPRLGEHNVPPQLLLYTWSAHVVSTQIRPDNPAYISWAGVILFSDLTYSAFVVPISIGWVPAPSCLLYHHAPLKLGEAPSSFRVCGRSPPPSASPTTPQCLHCPCACRMWTSFYTWNWTTVSPGFE